MAESVLSDVAARIISNLASPVLKEIGLLWGLKDELDKLKTTVSIIEAVLLDAEGQSMVNRQVKIWLGLLSEAMYDAEDLLDKFSRKDLPHQVLGGSKTVQKVRDFLSSSNQIVVDLKMAHKVKALRERLDEIAANRKFHLEERSVERVFVATGWRQTHSSPPQLVIGREADKKKILKCLLSSDYPENVSVVSIVGIGGLGKTTLAQLVYNDAMVQKHFELKMWICVSEDFNVHLLVKKVIESATQETPNVTEMDALKSRLHEKINGRKYLLVLDDVWDNDNPKWNALKDLLAGGARGSKIVLTTRSQEVAKMSGSIDVHELGDLSKDESWSLFKLMALKQGQVLSPSHEAIGKEIVAKCCGVPLAIRAIGGMLSLKTSESEWELLKHKELSKIDAYKDNILPILELSYNHLPSNYKHCFAYCSLYPKDYEIPVEELIHLWKAQGYLNSTDSDECLQDVGVRCFMDLFLLSFFQDAKKDYLGNITTCKMHDLMHDLAVSIAGNNFSVSLSKVTCVRKKTRHISFQVDGDSTSHDFSSLLKEKKLRTVRLVANGYFHIKREELDAVFCKLRCLRVLSLSRFIFEILPSSIDKLKHLSHLDLSYNHDIKKLPDSITNLQNLEVLKLKHCTSLKQLPDNIVKMVNLTDIDNDGCGELTHMPRGIGKMVRLEKLSIFTIAKDSSISSKHSGGLDELRALNNLRGSLEITNLKCVKDIAFEFKASLEKLQKLTLRWKDDWSTSNVRNDEMGLEALHPHQNLKELAIDNYRGVKLPSWLPSLASLVFLAFHDCRSIWWLPPLDQLPFLRKLLVVSSTKLELIVVAGNHENRGSSSFFPSLSYLTLRDCPNLKRFVRYKNDGTESSSISMEELPCFPCLSRLEIGGCPNLTYMPLFPKLKTLELGNDEIKSLMEALEMGTSESATSPFSTLSKLVNLTIWGMKDCAVDELLPYLPSLQYVLFSFEKDDGIQLQNIKADPVYLASMLNLFDPIQNLADSMNNLVDCAFNSVSLPKGLQYVTTLQRLHIDGCRSWEYIPEWMGRLNTLQDLTIRCCRHLSERCKNNTAEDWPKISHIPNIEVDYKIIQRNGSYML